MVALLARAWIEICIGDHVDYYRTRSLSLRERGLKWQAVPAYYYPDYVALLARAWIEISTRPRSNRHHDVALLARAWIEIYGHPMVNCQNQRRSPCESVD